MSEMKLGKLPDRTPVKHTIVGPPALNKRLIEYAVMYNEEHQQDEKPEELMPYMLDAFLKGDRAFARWQKKKAAKAATTPKPEMKVVRTGGAS